MVVRLSSFFHLLVRFCSNSLRPCQTLIVMNILADSYLLLNIWTCVQKKLMGLNFFFLVSLGLLLRSLKQSLSRLVVKKMEWQPVQKVLQFAQMVG
jgi:hypothetical protein